MLSFETTESGGVMVVSFGEVGEPGDERQAAQRQGLYQAIESRGDPRFAFDLSAVSYLTSSDIGFLITLRRRILARQGKVVLFSVDPYLVDILRTMKLHQLFDFADDLPGALAKLPAPDGA
jgi:anti-sigma B factor antagonist